MADNNQSQKVRIYISYNYKDREVALAISSELKIRGYEIVIDVDTLAAGQDWRKALLSGLKASDVFVVLITENSLHSANVLNEIGAARAFAEVSSKMLMIPVILDDIRVPDIVGDMLAVIAQSNAPHYIVDEIERAVSAFIGKRIAQEQHEVEIKKRIESNAAEFITEAITSLEKNESKNRWSGNLWYYLGYLTLVIGVIYGGYGFSQVAGSTDLQWIRFAYLGLKSLLVVGLLIACSKYAFTLGKSYMGEALKSADRIHAISFGKFYLRVYGEKAEWAELKEVFQHWNIDKVSSFSSLDTSQYDPKFLEAILEIAKVVSSKQESKK